MYMENVRMHFGPATAYSALRSLIARHKALWLDVPFAASAMIGLLLFTGSLFVNYNALKYATREVGSPTTDILLSNLPVINTDIVFSEGAVLFVAFIIGLLVWEPKAIPCTLKSIALFVCIRSGFVIMTHLGRIPNHIAADLYSLRYLSSGADLFFSGHTGLPFLMALLFWEQRHLRHVFLLCSAVAATAVIFGHLHYTIDVFSAFFITYGIYHLSRRFFPKDYAAFVHYGQEGA